MRTKYRIPVLIVGVAWASLVAWGTAAGQTDPVVARALFDEGRRLAGEGKYSQACPKLEESQKLDPGLGTLFGLADCLEHVGRTASAWSRFRDAADVANRLGQ